MKNKEEFKTIYNKWYVTPRQHNSYDVSCLQKEFKTKYENGMFRDLTTVTIEIMRQCNLNCQMCPITEGKFLNQNLEKMNFETYKSIIDNLPKTVKNVTPNGIGEGFIHPDFIDILKYTKDKGYQTSINSNGMLFELEALKYLDEIIFSMDSAVKHELEEIRSRVSYEKLIEIIQESKKYIQENNLNTKLSINGVISSINNKHIEKLFPLVNELNCDNLSLSASSNYFSLQTPKFIKFEENIHKNNEIEWDKIVHHVLNNNYNFDTKLYYPNIRKGLCNFGFTHLFIDNDQNVSLCCIKPRDTIIGTLKNMTFDEILNSKILQEYKDSQLNLTKYTICDYCTNAMPKDTYNNIRGIK